MRKLILVSALVFLGSCIEQPSTNPDGQIVVIGNGANGSAAWRSAIVADSQKENISKSFILYDDKTIAAPQPVSWVLPNTSGEEAVVKFQPPAIEKSICGVMKAAKNNFKCDSDLESLSLSDKFLPMFLKSGDILFVDSLGALYLQRAGLEKILIGKNISDFFIDAYENIFWKEIDKAWAISKVNKFGEVSVTKWLPNSAITYITSGGNIFVFNMEATELRTAAGIIKMNAQTFYQYDSLSDRLKFFWKKEDKSLNFSENYNRRNIQNGSLILNAKRTDSSENNDRLVLIDPSGIFEIPVEPQYLSGEKILVGDDNIFIRAPKNQDPTMIGNICAAQKIIIVSQDPQNPVYTCKPLKLPTGMSFNDAALAGDDLVISVNRKDSKRGLVHEVYALKSDVSSHELGHIQKTWAFDSDITALRYFGLEVIPQEDSATEMRQTNFGPNEKVRPNGNLTDK